MTELWQFVLIGLVTGSLYALIALGYTMVYGIIELINFAHGDLFMLGVVLRSSGRPSGSATRRGPARPGGALVARASACMLVAAPLFCAGAQRGGGPRRLQAAAERARSWPPLVSAIGV